MDRFRSPWSTARLVLLMLVLGASATATGLPAATPRAMTAADVSAVPGKAPRVATSAVAPALARTTVVRVLESVTPVHLALMIAAGLLALWLAGPSDLRSRRQGPKSTQRLPARDNTPGWMRRGAASPAYLRVRKWRRYIGVAIRGAVQRKALRH